MIQLLKKLLHLLWRTSADDLIVNQQKCLYPDSFYRGIQNEDDIDANHYLKSSAFLFGSQVRESDEMRELSIVWNDCEEALRLLMNQRNKTGTGFQFEPGYATIQMSKFTETVYVHINEGLVSYERKAICEDEKNGILANPYHGNVLLHKNASDQMKKNIQHTLATLATFTRR